MNAIKIHTEQGDYLICQPGSGLISNEQDILDVLDRAAAMKRGEPGKGPAYPLMGKSVGLLFDKPSTRTRQRSRT